jgi:N-acetylmuramoyl-L-alanine amidase
MITKKHQRFSYLSRLMMIPVIFILMFTFGVKANNLLTHPEPGPLKLEKKFTVVIDAGHGGDDAGAVSGSMKEKDIALSMALLIKSLSNNPNINIVLTRSTDELQPIKEKTIFSEQAKADLFVSLHVNQAASPDSSGITTYISAKNKSNFQQNVRLATLIVNNLTSVYKTDNTIRQRERQGVWILDNNKCPAALIECGYITNKNDRAFIGNSENQKKMAEKILTSIEEYFSKDVQVNTNPVKPTITMIRADTVVPGMKNEKITIVADSFIFSGYPIQKKSDTSKIPDNAIYTINGLTVTPEIVGSIDPGKIASVNVTKEDGKNLIDLILKKTVVGYPKDLKDPKLVGQPTDPNKEVIVKDIKTLPILFVDGKETTAEEAKKISADQIAELTVLRGEAAKALYGEKGKDGVMLITLKK